jgi:2,4-dienoyl-CoA reductase-like NADH-dependent reductase (Old Yellow Enzyme family)
MGFQAIELHMAHGYLLHEFLSPLSNQRDDEYGGSLEKRLRYPLEVFAAVMHEVGGKLPVGARLSATDWIEGGWDIEQSVVLCKKLEAMGCAFVDVSSGGTSHLQKIPVGPAYQTPFAERIKREAKIRTGAVGMITDPHQADEIIRSEKADLVLLAREFLRDPYWPLHAAKALGQDPYPPVQYQRAFS